MLNVLFSAKPAAWAEYETPLNAAFAKAGIAANLSLDQSPEDVDYIIFAPNGPVSDFRPFTKTKAVMGLWAGVETIVDNATLTQPLCRLVDESLTLIEMKQRASQRPNLGVDFTGSDFPTVANALGGHGVWVDCVEDLKSEAKAGFERDTFTVLACRIGRKSYDGKF